MPRTRLFSGHEERPTLYLSRFVLAGGGLVALALVGMLVLAAAPKPHGPGGVALSAGRGTPMATATETPHEAVVGDYPNAYLTLHDLKRHADLVAVVQITAQGVDTSPRFGPTPSLDNIAQVVQVLAGGIGSAITAGATIHIVQAGGLGVVNDGDPHATVGERAVAFLSATGVAGYYDFLTGAYGHYPSIGGYIHPLVTSLPSDFAPTAQLSALIDAGRMREADFIKTLLAA